MGMSIEDFMEEVELRQEFEKLSHAEKYSIFRFVKTLTLRPIPTGIVTECKFLLMNRDKIQQATNIRISTKEEYHRFMTSKLILNKVEKEKKKEKRVQIKID